MFRLRQAKRRSKLTPKTSWDERGPLLLVPEMVQHQDVGKVANDAVLVLEVIGKGNASAINRVRSEMVTDCAHGEIRLAGCFAAIDLWQGKAVETGLVS